MDQPASWYWFMFQGLASLFALLVGMRLGKRFREGSIIWFSVPLLLLGMWAWLKFNPSVAYQMIPLGILYYIEGTGAVPVFMLIVGCAYGRVHLPRQRRLTALAMAMGGVYFLQGGMWMLQMTPKQSFADTQGHEMVWQSQSFSCVPAACATALRYLDINATEAEMATLTQVRPGTGATFFRAAEALRTKLQHTDWQVNVLEPTSDQLQVINPPMLTPIISSDLRQLHMVVIYKVTANDLWVADPQNGITRYTYDQWQQVYTHRVIAFDK